MNKGGWKWLYNTAIGMIATTVMAQTFSKTPDTTLSHEEIAKLLNWVPDPNAPCSACGGYFFEPKDLRDHPTPPPYQQLPTNVTAKGPTIFSRDGASILQEDVRVTQTGRISKADKAYIFRDRKTGHITHVRLTGHVRMQEHDKLLVSKEANVDFKNQTAQVDHLVYRLTEEDNRMGRNIGWGSAKKANRFSNGDLKLEEASFSTCSPLKPTWEINAKKVEFLNNSHKGKAHGVVLHLGGFPIFYTPYISFSINKLRKSGWLSPNIQNSTNNGFMIGLPYYWNMAPNYDMLITPTYYTKRGFQLTSFFRYLTPTSIGNVFLSFLPNDTEFNHFRKRTIANFPSPVPPVYQPYINQLQTSSDTRAYFAFNNKSHFNENWYFDSQLNYVTDPYFFRDFGPTINDIVANQLLNQVNLRYEGNHWQFSLLGQLYQTLHLIDQANDPTVNQYMRLPELDTLAEYPALFGNVDLTLGMQFVNFAYRSNFPPFTNQVPIGQRYHIRPIFSQTISWSYGYVTPGLSLDSTTFDILRELPGQASRSRNLPIVDLDTGLYFNREFNLKNNEYIQTFEPRLFYLYVPYENQDSDPVFDSQVLPFTYEQLFSLNRFTSFDRLQNANQLSLGITSRIYNSDTSNQILNASVGAGYYIDKPRVCLSPGCGPDTASWTPISSELNFYPTPFWTVTGNFAWDPELSQTNNAEVGLSYSQDGRHIIGGSYVFVHAQPNSPNYSTTGFSGDSTLYKFFLAWPITHHLSGVGYLFYNQTKHRAENYFGGLQYDTCCISYRFIVSENYLGAEPINSGTRVYNRYNTNYIFQIQFKGLGSAGNDNPYAMLESAIPGYQDPFKY